MSELIKVKPYRIKFTKYELQKIEKNLIETNMVYSWLREKYSKRSLCRDFGVSHNRLYHVFTKPYTYLTFEILFTIIDLLPDRSPRDILMQITPTHKAWYDLDDTDLEILRKQLEQKNISYAEDIKPKKGRN